MLKKIVSLMLCLMIVVSVAVVSFSGVNAADADRDDLLRIKAGDRVYTVKVGDQITYSVPVTAANRFENVQAEIHYDSEYLKVVPVMSDNPDYDDHDAACFKCITNLVNGGSGSINLKMENIIKFNASRVAGYDFRETKTLVNVEFTAMAAGETEIDFDIIWMYIKGGEKAYFENGVAKVTEGIVVEPMIDDAEFFVPVVPTAPSYDYPDTDATADEPSVEDGTLYVFTDKEVYEVPVGQKFRYDIMLTAERIFQNIQVQVDYSADELSITRLQSPDSELFDWEYQSFVACPNLSGAIANLGYNDKVRFNSSRVAGYDFKEEKSIITLEFTAVAEGIAEIDFTVEEMTINGNNFYFTNSEPVITDGISIYGVTDAKISENPPERPTEPAVTYPTVEGDVVVHFDNYFKWENVYCYTYVDGGDREDLGEWPGTPCEKTRDGVWTVTIPGDCTHVVFNDGNTTSTEHLLNPLRERIATRFGSAGHRVGDHWRYSYAWFDYDPNPPTYPTYDPDWEETYCPTESPWDDEVRPGSPTTPGGWNPDVTLPAWDNDEWDETLPPTVAPTEAPTVAPEEVATETMPCATEGVPATEGNVVVKPQGKPDTPQSQEPKPTEGATSHKDVSDDTSVDVPTTGMNATAAIPVMLISLAGVLLMLRRRETE